MSISFSTALSALSAFSTAISVTGNNLANLNTIGFKTSEVSFHDLVTQSISAGLGNTQVGFGVGTPTTEALFTQGAIQTTGGTLDAAIQGAGFFVIQGPEGSIEYTRAGNFQTDQSGDLKTATGQTVQGWTELNGVLNTNAPPGNITIPTGTVQPPVVTQNFSFDLNLNAAATPGSATGTFATSVTVYDSLGNSHVVTATFAQDATTPGQWNYSISIPGCGRDNSAGHTTDGQHQLQFQWYFNDPRRNRSGTAIGDYRPRRRGSRHDTELELIQRHDAAHHPIRPALFSVRGCAGRGGGGSIDYRCHSELAARFWPNFPTDNRPWSASWPWPRFEIRTRFWQLAITTISSARFRRYPPWACLGPEDVEQCKAARWNRPPWMSPPNSPI